MEGAPVEQKQAKRVFRVLMLGYDYSGKTTILYRLKLGEAVTTIPTIGFNVETIISNNSELTVWDVGGLDRIRSLWTHYAASTDGFIYVVDSSDVDRMEDSKNHLANFVKSNQLENVPLLLLCNKQDLPGALTPMSIKENLDIQNDLFAKGCCAVTGEGLNEGIGWLTDCMLKSNTQNPPVEEVQATEPSRESIKKPSENNEKENESEKRKYKVLIIGLDISGKTTILYRLKLGETISTLPTIGFNVEQLKVNNTEFTLWDVGGSNRVRSLWQHYSQDLDGLIFAVDSSDRERISESKEVLSSFITSNQLEKVPLLVYCNKRDLSNAMSVIEIHEKLELKNNYFLVACCGITGDGLSQGVEWLAKNVDKGRGEEEEKDSTKDEQKEVNDERTEEKLESEKVENKPKNFRVLMIGLNNAGKTTILYKLKTGNTVQAISTIGFNVESIVSNSVELTLWDVGGTGAIRSLWRHYIDNTDGLIFVIDSSDASRIAEAKECLNSFVKDHELDNLPLLILLNKQDIPDAVAPAQLKEEIDLKNERIIIGCSAETGEGLSDGINWLADIMNR